MKYWKYSPGRGGRYWGFCKNNSLIAIGWSDVGDLTNYVYQEQLSMAFDQNDWASRKWNTGDTQLWNFLKFCDEEDIVVSYSRGWILCVGSVNSIYYFDEKNPIDLNRNRQYYHRKKVEWFEKTTKDVSENHILYGDPPATYGTLNKQLTFYEITDSYTINYINKMII